MERIRPSHGIRQRRMGLWRWFLGNGHSESRQQLRRKRNHLWATRQARGAVDDVGWLAQNMRNVRGFDDNRRCGALSVSWLALDVKTHEPIAGARLTLDCERDPSFQMEGHVHLRTVVRMTDAQGRLQVASTKATRRAICNRWLSSFDEAQKIAESPREVASCMKTTAPYCRACIRSSRRRTRNSC